MGSIAFPIVILAISAVSGLIHMVNATTASGHIGHWGQFFAGVTFLIVVLLSLASIACRLYEDDKA